MDKQCSDRDISDISKYIEDWKRLAPYFNISTAESREISEDCKYFAEQKREFLHRWRRKNGDGATLRELRSCLIKASETTVIRVIDHKFHNSMGVALNTTKTQPTNNKTADIGNFLEMSVVSDSPMEGERGSMGGDVSRCVDPKAVKTICKTHRPDLASAIDSVTDFCNRLEAASLIDEDLAEQVSTKIGVGKVDKVTELLRATEKVIGGSNDPLGDLRKLCEILCRYKTTERIANKMLQEAGMDKVFIPVSQMKQEGGSLRPLKSNDYNEFTVTNYGRPKLTDLLGYVTNEIPGSWEDVGVQLEIPTSQLGAIRMSISNGGLPKNFFRDVFDFWEKANNIDAPYSWKTFLEALASPFVGQTTLADRIADDLRARKAQ